MVIPPKIYNTIWYRMNIAIITPKGVMSRSIFDFPVVRLERRRMIVAREEINAVLNDGRQHEPSPVQLQISNRMFRKEREE